jgi:uncharacterized membrane protein
LDQGIGRCRGDNRRFLVLFVTQRLLDSFILFLTAPELAEDTADWIVNYLSSAVQRFSEGTKYFASVYLIVHGLIKIFLVVGLLRNKLWAYPLSLWFLGTFIVYPCYRFMHTHSIRLVLLTVFDLVVAFFNLAGISVAQDARTGDHMM